MVFNIGDAGEVSLRKGKQFSLRAVESGGIDRTGQISHEHAIARDVQRDADAFHQMAEYDFLTEFAVNEGAIHGIAAWRIAAIGPVQSAIFQIELQIDRLRQTVEQDRNIPPIRGSLPRGYLDIRAKDATVLTLLRAFLRPVDVLAIGIHRNTHAPVRRIAAVALVASGLHQCLDLGAVEIRAHDPHAFAVGPIELAAPLIEMDLLRREGG